jgi:acyl-CoA synthetase (AMP-forming)/AMP-acid ligase II
VKCLTQAWQWQAFDVMLHALPLHHVHGIINGLYCAHYSGAAISFLPKFSPAAVWKQLMVSALECLWVRCSLSCLCVTGGDAPHVLHCISRRLILVVGLGCSCPTSPATPGIEVMHGSTPQLACGRYTCNRAVC